MHLLVSVPTARICTVWVTANSQMLNKQKQLTTIKRQMKNYKTKAAVLFSISVLDSY